MDDKTAKKPENPNLGAKLLSIVVIKIVFITVIFFMFFGPQTRISQNPESVSQGILSPQTQLSTKGQ